MGDIPCTEEHIATTRRENWCNQVFEQDIYISTDAFILKWYSELGFHPVHFWQRRSTFHGKTGQGGPLLATKSGLGEYGGYETEESSV